MAAGVTLGLDWEALGAEASTSVSAAHAVLVTGKDPVAAARAALGIGRAQSRSRRVAIGDLIGEVEPLQSLVTGDDPHGIIDSFLYGVSLNKIARQVDESGTLFVMPSGTEPVVTPDILKNERWSRLAAGFREVGALLILVASSDADGVHELASMLDGVVVVGDATSVLSVPRNSVLAHVDAPPVVPEAPDVNSAVPVAPERSAPTASKPSPVLLPAQDVVEKRVRTPFPERDVRKQGTIAAAIVVALAAAWFAWTKFSSGTPEKGAAVPTTSAVNVTDSVAPAAGVVATAPSAPQLDSSTTLRVTNPQDSLKASAFGVVIVATNDEAQALAKWADLGLTLPAGTVTMVRIRGERGRFFQMQAGAYSKARQADSLLGALRASGKLKADLGRVVATPYALMLETVSRQAARNVANGYGQREIAAYPLLQADGSATIFVGAFESPEQAVPLMAELKAKGVESKLYYRTGRSF